MADDRSCRQFFGHDERVVDGDLWRLVHHVGHLHRQSGVHGVVAVVQAENKLIVHTVIMANVVGAMQSFRQKYLKTLI